MSPLFFLKNSSWPGAVMGGDTKLFFVQNTASYNDPPFSAAATMEKDTCNVKGKILSVDFYLSYSFWSCPVIGWNTDQWNIAPAPRLYGSVPFYCTKGVCLHTLPDALLSSNCVLQPCTPILYSNPVLQSGTPILTSDQSTPKV